MRPTLKRRPLLILATIIITIFLAVAVPSARKQTPASRQDKPNKEWLFSIPPTRSKVKDLQIINTRIVRNGTDTTGVAFEILNNSPRPVMAIRIACGDRAISQDGLLYEGNPIVIIEPFGTLSAEMTGELKEGASIVIKSATFQDKKEEGDSLSLDIMRRMRETKRAQRAAAREMRPAERGNSK